MTNSTRTELPAQIRTTALEGFEAAREAAAAAAKLAAAVAGAAAGSVRADAELLRTYIDHPDTPAAVRGQAQLGAIFVGSAAVGVIIIYLVFRKPNAGRGAHRR